MHNAQGISWNGSDTELAPFPRCCFVAWLDSFDVFLDTLIQLLLNQVLALITTA